MASTTLKFRRAVLASVAIPLICGAVALPVLSTAAISAPRSQLLINRVVFENNKKLKDEMLIQGIESKPRTYYSEAAVQQDIQRLREFYARSGRSAVDITARTVPVGSNSVDLVFTVDEGSKIGVEEIQFQGNNAFSAWRLKRQMATVESGWLGWLRSTDTYDPDRIAADSEALRRFYVNRGYPDFRVVSTNVTLNGDQSAYIITFVVDEGERYDFGAVNVESRISEVSGDELSGAIRTSSGSTYDAEEVDKTIEDMTTRLARSGHPFAQVRPIGMRDPAGRTVGVTYLVEEGARVYIERINISGNTRTRDYVIRREFDLGEGDAFNKAMIDRAARRLRNLGYFESVQITNMPGSAPDRVIIDVRVVDQSTGDFSIGGGYSTSDGFMGEISLSERNFLGRGQYVKVALQYGQKTEGFDLSFTEPYFFGHRIAAGFDIYSKSTDAGDNSYYDSRVTGGTLRASFPITDELAVGVRYTGYDQEIDIPNAAYLDGNPANGEASRAIQEMVGSRFVSMVGYTVIYSTLDDRKNPTEGLYGEFKQDIAGLGGDAHFVRTTGDVRYYYPLTDDLTLMARAQAGHIAGWNGDLRVSDQFNLGPSLVRGFAPSGIGPRDIYGGGRGNALGGTAYYGATLELQFPILGLPRELGLRGALYADAGSLFDYGGKRYDPATFQVVDDNSIRSSVGASLLWASPLGPLRFDYSWVLSKDGYDRTQAFHFSGGTSF